MKIRNILELLTILPEEERIMTDVLRQIILENLPPYAREGIAYNVPFYYGHRRICLIWPATVPRGGIKKGVMLGFCYGNRLPDRDRFLSHGTNRQVYYKIYHDPAEMEESPIRKLLMEAVEVDHSFR